MERKGKIGITVKGKKEEKGKEEEEGWRVKYGEGRRKEKR